MPGRKNLALTIHLGDSGQRTITIPHAILYGLFAILATIFCSAVGGAVHYWKLSTKLTDYMSLVQENKEMRLENQKYHTMTEHIREKLSFLEMTSKKLTITAGLESPKPSGSK